VRNDLGTRREELDLDHSREPREVLAVEAVERRLAAEEVGVLLHRSAGDVPDAHGTKGGTSADGVYRSENAMTDIRSDAPAIPAPRRSPEALSEVVADPPSTAGVIPAQRIPQDGLGQVTAMARDGFTGLARVHRSPRRALLLGIWLVGIVGDAVTTLLLLQQPGREEANPSALIGMGFVGVPGYVALASAICLLFAVVSTGRPLGRVAQATALFLFAVAAGKIVVLVHNLILWWGPR
jgi:hypothetical protein